MSAAPSEDVLALQGNGLNSRGGSFESHAGWASLQQMVLPMAVRIPLCRLTLGQLRALEPGVVIESEWPVAEEVPLFAANVALSWCEFAVAEGVMAARLTRLG